MKKILKITILTVLLALNGLLFFEESAIAQTNFQPPTVLPATDDNLGGRTDACTGLATMIRMGNINLRNIPCFIKFFTQTLISISGSLAVIFIMIGGYRYIIGGDEDKDAAKKTITYAVIGLIITLLAWIITDLALQVATE